MYVKITLNNTKTYLLKRIWRVLRLFSSFDFKNGISPEMLTTHDYCSDLCGHKYKDKDLL